MSAETTKPGMPLHTRIFIGLLLGAVCGGIAQATLGRDNAGLKAFVEQVAGPIGKIFLNMIFMVVVPLLFSALVNGVAEIGDARKVGRIGLRSLGLTVLLSGLAVVIGIVAVNVVRPGDGIAAEERTRLVQAYGGSAEKAAEAKTNAEKASSVGDAIADLVPRNPLQSAVEALTGGLLPFMVFAFIFGLALSSIEPEKGMPVKQLMEGIFAVSLRIIDFAMKLAPIGVFALVFSTAALLGVEAFVALGKYAFLVIAALAFHLVVVYGLALKLIAKWNPLDFFMRIKGVIATAFATASSNATLPTALRSAEEDLGLPRNISSFVLTIGATANQNGTALFEGITVLFLAQFFGIDLSLADQLVVMGLAILAGVGTAGVPGGSWPMIAIILIKVGVPPEAIALCLGIDRILDMSRTVLNVTGDLTIAACVSRMEGTPTEAPA